MFVFYYSIYILSFTNWRYYVLTLSWRWSCVMGETGRSNFYMAYCNKWEINSPVRNSQFALLGVFRLNLSPCFRKWDMSIKGKTALVTGAATGIGLEYVKALLKNGAQVSYIVWITLSCKGSGWNMSSLTWHSLEEEGVLLVSNIVMCQGSMFTKHRNLWLRLYMILLFTSRQFYQITVISATPLFFHVILYLGINRIEMYSKCCL